VTADAAGVLHLQLVQESGPGAKGIVPKLAGIQFANDKMFVLECGSDEVWLWYGGSTVRQAQKDAAKLANALAARVKGDANAKAVLVRARMESILFQEHFKDLSETFSGIQVAAAIVDVRRGLDGEIQRMISPLMGTLAMLSSNLGDVSRNGLKMDFAVDESGLLQIWRIRCNDRALQSVQIADAGFFVDTDAFAILYTCKGGARSVMYLWVGRESPASTRAALALQARDIILSQRLQGSVDQLGLEQGREPPLLLAVLEQKANPLVVLRGVDSSTISQTPDKKVRVLEFGSNDLRLPGDAPAAYEKPVEQIEALGFHPQKVYVVLQLLRSPSPSCQVWIRVGRAVDVPVIAAARRVAQRIPALLAMTDATPQLAIQPTVMEVAHGSEPVDLLRAVGLSARAIKSETYGHLTRPRRVFEVSDTRRVVGAMFVEEIGMGSVYLQSDLKVHACYILDTGRASIYLWTGPDATYKCFALAVRICRKYMTANVEFPDTASAQLLIVDSGAENAEVSPSLT
jgi:hypothetical protein